MIVAIKPAWRGIGIAVAATALLVGAFLLGSARSGTVGDGSARGGSGAVLLASSAAGGKITVTGTGTITGRPNQLVLSMGVQTSASSVSTALRQANEAASRVIGALTSGGVRKPDIATSGLSVQPDYRDGSPLPTGYAVSEQLTATLRDLARAGSQIQAAVRAGRDATTVNGVSLNLTDTGSLLARARAAAVRDAQSKAGQFARALGSRLGAVLSVSDQSAAIPYPENFAAASFKSASPVPVSPGRQQVSVQITIVYAIG